MRKLIGPAALLVGGLLLAGCTSSSSSALEGGAGSVNASAVIDIQVGLEPTSLDVRTTSGAALVQLMRGNVYQGLVGISEDLEILPALASEWEISEDGLTYTFTVREGVKFHDGTDMTIDDVVRSLEAASADDSLNPDAKRMGAVDAIEATDDTTVVITLTQRDINFLDTLTTAAGFVTPHSDGLDLSSSSNGTGPYTVDQWNQGSTISLVPFTEYWGDAPQNGGVTFHYITDPTTAATALRSGEIDMIAGTTPETAALFADDDAFTVTEGASTNWMTLGFNNTSGPLADQRVRQALRQGINKQELIEVIGGGALEVGSMTVPTDPWYVDTLDVAPFDQDAAKQLLADAGHENLELTLTVSNTYDTIISEFIAAELAEIGVNVTIDSVEFATWLEKAYTNKDYELTMVLHVDPSTLSYYGNPAYYWNYDNAEAQQLVAESSTAASVEERNEKLSKLAQIVAEDSASDWLYSPQTLIVTDSALDGYPTGRIANNLRLSTITVTE